MTRLPVAHGRWKLSLAPDFTPPAHADAWTSRHRGPHSLIFDLAGTENVLAKLVRPRSRPRDDLRKYAYSQALREYNGSRQLQRLGLDTPHPLGWGVCLTPFARFESVLFMRELPAFTSGLMLIRKDTDSARRTRFLHRFADQLATLHGSGWVHRDCHFDNICIAYDERLVWIDNDIRPAKQLTQSREGLRKTLQLLKTTARGAVTDTEWHTFHARLKASLERWPDGTYLADEVSRRQGHS